MQLQMFELMTTFSDNMLIYQFSKKLELLGDGPIIVLYFNNFDVTILRNSWIEETELKTSLETKVPPLLLLSNGLILSTAEETIWNRERKGIIKQRAIFLFSVISHSIVGFSSSHRIIS